MNRKTQTKNKSIDVEIDEGRVLDFQYTQKFINLYCPESFKSLNDITPENLHIFLEIMLKQYQYYNMDIHHIKDLAESVGDYLYDSYIDQFSEGVYCYPNNDRRSLSDFILTELDCFSIFPSDVPFVLECLNCEDNEVALINDRLKAYFEQFDQMQKMNVEHPRRWQAIKRERIEALAKNEPLPIRPMSITLDPCYKKNN